MAFGRSPIHFLRMASEAPLQKVGECWTELCRKLPSFSGSRVARGTILKLYSSGFNSTERITVNIAVIAPNTDRRYQHNRQREGGALAVHNGGPAMSSLDGC
jgi:hypothetical protein